MINCTTRVSRGHLSHVRISMLQLLISSRHSTSRWSTKLLTTAVVAATLFAACAEAQSPNSVLGASAGIAVGGDLNEYLRYLQSEGKVPLVTWGLRGFSPNVVDSLTTIGGNHPWKNSWMFRPEHDQYFRIIPIDVMARFNSAYPYGINEGPVWSGKGATTAVSAGVMGTWGPLSVVIKPIVFWAQNSAFATQPTGEVGNRAFEDALYGQTIDRPQRFGRASYTHVDPGETTVRFDGWGVSLGATSANEWWGPATMFPYLVGNNAAGVPHVFLGTERPTNIYIGTLQARVEYGMEFQSPYSPVQGSETFRNVDSTGTRRVMSGLILTFSPRGIPGLELGGARYFHRPWTGSFTASDLKSPFEGLLTASPNVTAGGTSYTSAEVANQLASVWMRWVFPHSGLEVYGEYGHEDHNIDLNDLYAELDHSRTAMLGFRKAFMYDSSGFQAVRMEWFDGTQSTNARHRAEGAIYLHSVLHQGHTEEGKVIGTGTGIGTPAAAQIAWDRYAHGGRITAYAMRMSESPTLDMAPDSVRVTGVLGVDMVRFAQAADITIGAALAYSTRGGNFGNGWNGSINVGLRVWKFR